MMSLHEFIKNWVEKTSGMTPEQCGHFAWDIMNEAWSRGYKQGKDDPDFENSGDEIK